MRASESMLACSPEDLVTLRSVSDRFAYSELLRIANLLLREARALVESWLERCDIVKYGGLRATREDAGKTLDDARALVVTTTDAIGRVKEAA